LAVGPARVGVMEAQGVLHQRIPRSGEPSIGLMPTMRIACCVIVAVLCSLAASPAEAAPVLVLGKDGRARVHRHSLAPAVSLPRPPRSAAPRELTRRKRQKTVIGALKAMLASGAIDQPTYDARRASYDQAKRAVKSLKGTRRTELAAVVKTADGIAARGMLTPSRLYPIAMTLDRNREWWTTGPLLASGRRVGFSGSQIVWQYYPGQGIQIQVLGTFGKVNALWSSRQTTALSAAVDELLPLAAERAGGLAWEYYFTFAGGAPPWVSGLAQGTALQALARAATRLHREADVFPVTSRALAIFQAPPPEGVLVPVGAGAHYAQYSFDPGLRVLNGFIQSLVGLYDYARLAADPAAKALFDQGVARAREEVPTYDTGAWSLYSRGSSTHESDLNYHTVLRDFLESLCNRTADPVFCGAEEHFTLYLSQPPVVALRTTELRGGRYGRIRLKLSKISNVTLRITRGTKLVHTRYVGTLARGKHSLGWQVPRKRGGYEVELAVRDLAGNPASTAGEVEVLKPLKKKRRKKGPQSHR
jgi:D-glucuronyl C5-epimerase C-terminus